MMIELKRRLDAATGYFMLGMIQDAWDELEALPPELRVRDEVLEARIEIYHHLGKWETARILAESLAGRSPENPVWWIHWAYSLRREKSVEAAREVLEQAVLIHADMPLISYNLACYACVTGDMVEAGKLLQRAVTLDPGLKLTALKDPDLEAIFGAGKSVSGTGIDAN